MPASFAGAERAASDPSQCLFNCAEESTVSLVQADLKLCFNIGIGLVDGIPLWTSRWRKARPSLGAHHRQLALLLK
jgi:hypothetical protein